MPVRKKSRVVQLKAKTPVLAKELAQDTKKSSIHVKADSSRKTNTDRAIVSALKENNKCLATALDESRHDFRKLQAKYVNLQRERQQLLEKIASLESKVSHQNLLCSQIQPACILLEQATKDISGAENHLKGIFISHKKELSRKYEPLSNSISAPPSSPILAESDTAFIPSACLEANEHTECHTASTCIGTPPSSREPCLPRTNSTPTYYGCDNSAQNLCTRQRCALEFEDSVIEADHFGLSGSTIKKSWDRLEAHDKWETSDCRNDSVHSLSRPQRKCATINISYQEPDLKKKLCEDDHIVDSSLSVRPLRKSSRCREKSHSALPKCRQRLALQDISNRVKQKDVDRIPSL